MRSQFRALTLCGMAEGANLTVLRKPSVSKPCPAMRRSVVAKLVAPRGHLVERAYHVEVEAARINLARPR